MLRYIISHMILFKNVSKWRYGSIKWLIQKGIKRDKYCVLKVPLSYEDPDLDLIYVIHTGRHSNLKYDWPVCQTIDMIGLKMVLNNKTEYY